MEEKIANHACMNECFFLEFHMARSHIEMKQSEIEMAGSDIKKRQADLHSNL